MPNPAEILLKDILTATAAQIGTVFLENTSAFYIKTKRLIFLVNSLSWNLF